MKKKSLLAYCAILVIVVSTKIFADDPIPYDSCKDQNSTLHHICTDIIPGNAAAYACVEVPKKHHRYCNANIVPPME